MSWLKFDDKRIVAISPDLRPLGIDATYDRPTSEADVLLYRFYGGSGELLYVGITEAPIGRWSAHRQREWWPLVAGVRAEWLPTRKEASDLERRAIATEKPLHNILDTPLLGERRRLTPRAPSWRIAAQRGWGR